MSRRSKIFVIAAISKSWAEIWPRGHIFGRFKILDSFLWTFLPIKSENIILLGKSWAGSTFLDKNLFPLKPVKFPYVL